MQTENMNADQVRAQFDKVIDKASRKQTRVLVEKAGIPAAAIVSPADLETLQRLERQREELFKVLDRMRGAFADVPEEELEREIDRALAEVRAENRAAEAAVRSLPTW